MDNPATSLLYHQVGILFVGSCLYGAFLVLFVLSALVLHHQVMCNKRRSSGSVGTTVYLSLGYLLLTPITLSWVISWVFFIRPDIAIPSQADTYSVFVYVQNAIGYLSVLIADWILVFRLYVIWEKKKAILWAATLLSLVYLGPVIRGFVYYAERKQIWSQSIKVFVITSVFLNVTTTVLITWKIWQKSKLTRALGGQKIITTALAILIESAALYTVWMLLFLTVYFMDNHLSHVFLYGTPSIAGIATTLVNVRVGLGWATGEEGRSTYSLRNSVLSDPEVAEMEE